MTTPHCAICRKPFDPALTVMDDICSACFEESMIETAVFEEWWESMTPYQQDEYLRSQGIDPILLAAETIILIKQLKDKYTPTDGSS